MISGKQHVDIAGKHRIWKSQTLFWAVLLQWNIWVTPVKLHDLSKVSFLIRKLGDNTVSSDHFRSANHSLRKTNRCHYMVKSGLRRILSLWTSSAGKQTVIQERHLPDKGEREGQHYLRHHHHHHWRWTFLCIRVPRKQGKGAEWVHWMFWLMWVPTFKCQSLLPHLMYKEHSWLYVTASQPGQWRPPSLVSRTHSYSNAALLWGPNIRSSPADVSFLWFFTLLGPH